MEYRHHNCRAEPTGCYFVDKCPENYCALAEIENANARPLSLRRRHDDRPKWFRRLIFGLAVLAWLAVVGLLIYKYHGVPL
jgi:hypothetical protein